MNGEDSLNNNRVKIAAAIDIETSRLLLGVVRVYENLRRHCFENYRAIRFFWFCFFVFNTGFLYL